MVAADAQDVGVDEGTFVPDGDIGRSTTDIDECATDFFFVVAEYGSARGERRIDEVVDVEMTAIDAFDDVIGAADRPCNDVDFGFESDAIHPDGATDSGLIVEDVFLRQDV